MKLATAARWSGRLAAALGALAVLAVGLAGLPWLLIGWIGWPLPDHLPTLHEVLAVLSSPLDDQRLLDTLAILGWAVWALFVRDLALEIMAAIGDLATYRRTGQMPRRGGSRGPVRLAAAVLVGAITAALALQLARALTSPAPRTATNTGPSARPPAAVAAGATGPATVAPDPGDAGLTAPAGTPATSTANGPRPAYRVPPRPLITHPGPITATDTGAPSSAAPAAEATAIYTVVDGDNLWDIAATQIGDPTRWREIYTLNRGAPQPDGYTLDDPDDIHIGWVLTLPAATPAAPPPPSGNGGHGNTPPTPSPPTSAAPAIPHQTTPPPSPDPITPPAETSTSPSTTTPSTAAPDPATGHHEQRPGSRSGVVLPSGAWIGTGLAAALATAAATALLYRRRRRRLRWPIPVTTQPVPTRVPDSLSRARDVGMTTLLQRAREADEPFSDQPVPGSGLVPPLPEPEAAVAVDEGGAEIGLEPLTVDGLALTGPGAQAAARGVLAAALSAGTLADPDHRITVITSADLLATLLPEGTPLHGLDPHGRCLDGERLHLHPTGEQALAAFEQESLYRQRILAQYNPDDPDQAADGHAMVASMGLTLLVLCADPGQVARVNAVLTAATGLRLGAVLLADTTALPRLELAADGTNLDQSNLDQSKVDQSKVDQSKVDQSKVARIATLGAGELADTLDLLRTASAVVNPPEPPDDLLPEPDSDHRPSPAGKQPQANEPDPAATPVLPPTAPEPLVRLTALGPPAVTTHTGPVQEIRAAGHAVLTLLAAHPHGLTRDEALDALYPEVEPAAASARWRTACTSLRRTLRAATGHQQEEFVLHDDGRYRLDPDVIEVDAWRMLTALDRANHTSNDTEALAALTEAVDLYRGEFGDGLDHAWVPAYTATYRRHAIDALARIAEIHELDHPDTALAALDQAVEHDPVCEELYQRIMIIQGRLGRTDAVRRTLNRCAKQLEAIQTEPSDATRRIAARQLRPPAA